MVADRVIIIDISVVYQALVRQRMLFLEPAVRSMVETIPLSWLVKDLSLRNEDVQILRILLHSDALSSFPDRAKY